MSWIDWVLVYGIAIWGFFALRAYRRERKEHPREFEFHMIWIDRLGLVWVAVVWGAFFLLANGHDQPSAALNIEVIKAVGLICGLPWLILRGLYFVGRGA